jgi:hypothetical protein
LPSSADFPRRLSTKPRRCGWSSRHRMLEGSWFVVATRQFRKGSSHPIVHRFFHMGLAALHAAREPLSDCMTVVPSETAALADFRRRPTCGEDADPTGGRPAFFERGAVGDFFLAGIRASCLKTDESPSRVRTFGSASIRSRRGLRGQLFDRAKANDMLPATALCLGLPNDQSWAAGHGMNVSASRRPR